MCLSLTPVSAKRPSIVLTRASVEREGEEGQNSPLYQSIGSRLPSHLSLGSSSFAPTPAPTSPLSLFMDGKDWPGPGAARSVTPLLFLEHQLNVPLNKWAALLMCFSPVKGRLPQYWEISFMFFSSVISYLMIIDDLQLRIEDKFSLSVILAFSSGRTNSHIWIHSRKKY